MGLTQSNFVQTGYDELVNAIIRPPRAIYAIDALGPSAFRFCSKRYRRKDFTLVNQRGLTLQCSHWEPFERSAGRLPCVVYVHGNSSGRFEVIGVLSVLLSIGVTVFAFDCSGSGKSEGKYVSLGYHEREDLRVVVDHLRGSGTVSTLGVWGRSMGAVTGLMYQARDVELLKRMSVDSMVLDSPFSDFPELAEELVKRAESRGVYVPGLVTKMALHMLQGSIKELANFSINDLTPLKFAKDCSVPALFIAAREDDFISAAHSEKIYEAYVGAKSIAIVDGDHNSDRDSDCLSVAAAFLVKYMRLPTMSSPTKDSPSRFYGIAPWNAKALSRVRHASTFSTVGNRQPTSESALKNAFRSDLGRHDGAERRPRDDPLKRSTHLLPSARARAGRSTGSAQGRDGKGSSSEDQAYFHCSRGNALEESGDVEGAILAYKVAIQYMPKYADAYYNLGIALKSVGQLDAAIAEYEKAIKCKHDHPDAHNNLGVAWEEKGNIEKSLRCYKDAIRHKPDHAEAHSNLADALQSMGRLEQAVKEYQIAISHNSQDASAINNMGVALEAQGHIDAAIQAYTTAVANKPTHWDAQCNLADALHSRGQLETAISLYRLIVKNNPGEASVYSSLGNALQAKGDLDEAIKMYKSALDRKKDDATTHNNLGIAQQAKGRIKEAVKCYSAAILIAPEYAIAHYNLGVVYQSMNNVQKAIKAYQAAISIQQSYPDAHINLGVAFESSGNEPKAVQCYQAALKYRPSCRKASENLARLLKGPRRATADAHADAGAGAKPAGGFFGFL
jgi:tetratricopeptide (TPR) repeat protein/fermentation-respiration switch protein FrsA (DUF1100 family)